MDEWKEVVAQYIESMNREATMMRAEINALRVMNDELRQRICDISVRLTKLEIDDQCDLK